MEANDEGTVEAEAAAEPDDVVEAEDVVEAAVPPDDAEPADTAPPTRLAAFGLPEHVHRSLGENPSFELADPTQPLDAVDLVVVSTRLPRPDLRAALARCASLPGVPVIALVHSGGEATAVQILRQGGTAVVAEGNEASLRALGRGEAHETDLLETFEARAARFAGSGRGGGGHDPVALLPDRVAFEERLSELARSGDVLRVAILRPRDLGRSHLPSSGVVRLLRRRLAAVLRQLASVYRAEPYSFSDFELAVIGRDLNVERAEELGRELCRVGTTFAPLGTVPLHLVFGHAGEEVTSEPAALVELALRAADEAALDPRTPVLGAGSLALGASATTELEAAMLAIEDVDERSGRPPGRAERVRELCLALAGELELGKADRSRLGLAATLHEIGLAGLPKEVLTGGADLEGEHLELWRSHPARGEAFLLASAGEEVATIVRGQREGWDGSGFPDGLTGEDIPLAARILAVAVCVEEGIELLGDPVAALKDAKCTRLDPELVELALPLVDTAVAKQAS